jgi:hypothetical protein
MDAMADTMEQNRLYSAPDSTQLIDPSLIANPRTKEYTVAALTRFGELQNYMRQIGTEE